MNTERAEQSQTRLWKVDVQGFTGNSEAASTCLSDSQKVAAELVHHIEISEASDLLAAGKLVAFPTETVYGLGADARNTDAVAGIFAAKGRPSDNPLIVHIADRAELDAFVLEVSEADEKLMNAFWPGPLTLVLPVRPGALSPKVTAGLDTVAVRMPDNGIALALIRSSGCPLAGPSANRSGRPSPTLAVHVQADLEGRIDGIVDGGAAGVGVESTVVRTHPSGGATVLRPGGISVEELSQVLDAPVKEVSTDDGAAIDPEEANVMDQADPASDGVSDTEAPRSPGMKYTHYAPSGLLEVVVGEESQVTATISKRLAAAKLRGEITGVLVFEEHLARYREQADMVVSLGSQFDLREAASKLYAALRQFDEVGTTYIVAEGCREDGIGAAIMNRMSKAAGGRVQQV